MRNWLIIGAIAVVVLIAGVFIIGCDTFSGKCFAGSSDITGQKAIITTIPITEFKSKTDSGEYKLIDIRTLPEYQQGHLKNSTQIDFYKTAEFSSFLQSLDKNGKYLIYCRSGNRSGQALSQMKDMGFQNVSDLSGGINAWTSANYPIEQ